MGKNKIEDITNEFYDKARPGEGEIVIPAGYDVRVHAKEIEVASLLIKEFGGIIKPVVESNYSKEKTPDYLWNGEKWELKEPTSRNAIDKRIRKSLNQIHESGGGIILDVTKCKMPESAVLRRIEDSLSWRCKNKKTVIVIKNNRVTRVIAVRR